MGMPFIHPTGRVELLPASSPLLGPIGTEPGTILASGSSWLRAWATPGGWSQGPTMCCGSSPSSAPPMVNARRRPLPLSGPFMAGFNWVSSCPSLSRGILWSSKNAPWKLWVYSRWRESIGEGEAGSAAHRGPGLPPSLPQLKNSRSGEQQPPALCRTCRQCHMNRSVLGYPRKFSCF